MEGNRTRGCPWLCSMKTIAEKTENIQVLTLLPNAECCQRKALWQTSHLQPSSVMNNFCAGSGPHPALSVHDDNSIMPNVWPQQIFSRIKKIECDVEFLSDSFWLCLLENIPSINSSAISVCFLHFTLFATCITVVLYGKVVNWLFRILVLYAVVVSLYW